MSVNPINYAYLTAVANQHWIPKKKHKYSRKNPKFYNALYCNCPLAQGKTGLGDFECDKFGECTSSQKCELDYYQIKSACDFFIKNSKNNIYGK